MTERDLRVGSQSKATLLQVAFGHRDDHGARLLIKMDPYHQVQQMLFLVLRAGFFFFFFYEILVLLADVVLSEGVGFLVASQPHWSGSTNMVVSKNGSASQSTRKPETALPGCEGTTVEPAGEQVWLISLPHPRPQV